MNPEHYRRLEKMFLQANINTELYDTTTVKISEGLAEVGLQISDKYFHALGAIHGSVYFKLLDDAAFFAVNSMIEDAFVLTTSFNINLTRPANKGTIKAIGKVKFRSRNLFVAESTLYNEDGKEIGFGTGNFAKSKIALTEKIGYK
ncbi:PaaI family thioesterase [Aquimarina sp. 2201CG5-10]|uniref:PaaI family thioesterase n=1 Tax=Aquimarina callyspongiae TaxID=3098150 RepID=UPI002AB45322|nr:PaaI family thioesterase [Aquimarina sp. 2201CG5-10]MDY8135289.1 PaaI family thioesterase [Aquimarina sp. 2201CG5-10]